jgi:hypothetical protein
MIAEGLKIGVDQPLSLEVALVQCCHLFQEDCLVVGGGGGYKDFFWFFS